MRCSGMYTGADVSQKPVMEMSVQRSSWAFQQCVKEPVTATFVPDSRLAARLFGGLITAPRIRSILHSSTSLPSFSIVKTCSRDVHAMPGQRWHASPRGVLAAHLPFFLTRWAGDNDIGKPVLCFANCTCTCMERVCPRLRTFPLRSCRCGFYAVYESVLTPVPPTNLPDVRAHAFVARRSCSLELVGLNARHNTRFALPRNHMAHRD